MQDAYFMYHTACHFSAILQKQKCTIPELRSLVGLPLAFTSDVSKVFGLWIPNCGMSWQPTQGYVRVISKHSIWRGGSCSLLLPKFQNRIGGLTNTPASITHASVLASHCWYTIHLPVFVKHRQGQRRPQMPNLCSVRVQRLDARQVSLREIALVVSSF